MTCRGWGLRCLDDIPRGGFICIYAGQLLTDQGANEDGQQYGDEYLAELDYIEVCGNHWALIGNHWALIGSHWALISNHWALILEKLLCFIKGYDSNFAVKCLKVAEN